MLYFFLLFTSNKETIHEKNHDNGSKTKPYNFSVYALDLFINLKNFQNVIRVPYSSFMSMYDRNYTSLKGAMQYSIQIESYATRIKFITYNYLSMRLSIMKLTCH